MTRRNNYYKVLVFRRCRLFGISARFPRDLFQEAGSAIAGNAKAPFLIF
jgi:hypothetical protein